MILRLPRNFIYPLATLSFIAIPIAYVNIVFTTTTRWIFLAALMLALLAKGRLFMGYQSLFGVALLVYSAWCVATSTWSEVPELSIAKSLAFSLVAVTFVSAGYSWVRDRGTLSALGYLAPVAVVAFFAGMTGRVDFRDARQQIELYQGLTNNPNMLGSLIAMALPLLLWSAYKFRGRPRARWFWFALVVIAAGLLARTYSRSSILSAGLIGIGFCASLKLPRTSFILALIAGALFVAAAASTAVLDVTYQKYILKGGTEEQGALYSREQVWQKSYENAVEGGFFGAGYGVTVGDTEFNGGLTAVGYGREKGNAQLAIVEETGVVGMALYLIMLFALFAPLVSAHLREKNSDLKVALGLVTGALAGFIAMSIFEAWWVAPGSPESAYFWGLAGVGLCLSRNPIGASIPLHHGQIPQRQAFYPAKFRPQKRL